MKNRKEFTTDREEELEAITMDSGKTAAIFEAMKTTIGKIGWMSEKWKNWFEN